MFAKHCKDKRMALKAMQEELNGWGERYIKERIGDVTLTEEAIVETRYFQHRKCETCTVSDDDNLCHECGEPCGTVGRKCFAVYFWY